MWEDKGGQGLWTERINDETGESSLKIHNLKQLWKSCPRGKCYFELTTPREAKCKKCGKIIPIIVGKHKIIDGKITSN